MQIGMSTASLFNRRNLEDIPPMLASLGVRICEVFLNTFSEYEEPFIEMFAARLREADVQVYSVHPMGTQFEPQLFSIYERQRTDALRIFKDVLHAGYIMGARYYVMHGPASLGGAVKNMQLERIGPMVQELCEIAREYSMGIAWENVSWGLYAEPTFGQRLLKATGADDLRFTLDIKQAVRSGYTPEAYLKEMASHMVNLHICDYMHESTRIIPALPGKGECDLQLLHKTLIAAGYQGPAMYEVYSDLYQDEQELFLNYRYVKTALAVEKY